MPLSFRTVTLPPVRAVNPGPSMWQPVTPSNVITPAEIIAGGRPSLSGAASGAATGGIGAQSFGAGQGSIPATGQLADNPFNNSFNFSIPQPSTMSTDGTTTTTSSGYGQYLPIIVVGVIVAGLGWFLFERKKR